MKGMRWLRLNGGIRWLRLNGGDKAMNNGEGRIKQGGNTRERGTFVLEHYFSYQRTVLLVLLGRSLLEDCITGFD